MSKATDAERGKGRAFWMGVALLCAVPALGGCSFVFSSGPPSDAELAKGTEIDCKTSKVPPVLDTIFAGLQVARTGLAIAVDDSVYRDAPLSRGADIGIGVGLTALFLGSAIYGYSASSRCADVKSRDGSEIAMDWSRQETPEPHGLGRSPAAPREAAGFVFGTTKQQAASACRQAGLEWSDGEDAARCSGTLTQGIPDASAEIHFADGLLSAVDLVIHPPDDAQGWVSAFKTTETTLIRLYGKPDQHSFRVPDECKAEDRFLACVAEGKVPGSARWSLADGRLLVLSIASAPPPSTIRVHLTPG